MLPLKACSHKSTYNVKEEGLDPKSPSFLDVCYYNFVEFKLRKMLLTVRRHTPSHMRLKFVTWCFQIDTNVPGRVYKIFIWHKKQRNKKGLHKKWHKITNLSKSTEEMCHPSKRI